MSFKVGSILYFSEYQFTDTGETAKHFALTLLPEDATKYQNSVLCSVITSTQPKSWSYTLKPISYNCFNRDSYICFNRKDLESKSGLHKDDQPRAVLTQDDLGKCFKILKSSLYVIQDIGSNFFKAAIIFQWKKALGQVKL